MLYQETISGKPEGNPWDHVCCEACYNAEGEQCVCKCGGRYHGIGKERKAGEDQRLWILWDSKILKELWSQIEETRCKRCNANLEGEPIHYYPHSRGWDIQGLGLVWLYIVCPNCRYQWALWKLGVSRQ